MSGIIQITGRAVHTLIAFKSLYKKYYSTIRLIITAGASGAQAKPPGLQDRQEQKSRIEACFSFFLRLSWRPWRPGG
jgi:hypothetical protein